MANNLGGAVTKFTKRLDTILEKQTCTADLNMNQDLLGELSGAGTIEIAKIAMDGLADHTRGGGFVKGGATLEWEKMQLEFERDREFEVDVLDDEERELITSANLMGEFARTKVVPEVDAIRFARLAENSGNTETADITAGSALVDAIDLGEEAMQDNGEELSGCILYLTSRMKTLLKRAQPYRMGQGENPNGNFDTYDDMRIRVVPSDRFYSAISLLDGKSEGEKQGGYIKAAGNYYQTTDTEIVSGKTYYAKSGSNYTAVASPVKADLGSYYERAGVGCAINFMVLSPKAAAAITKHEKLRYFPPDVNQNDEAHLWQYRLYHDLLVYEMRKQLIYTHLATA